MPPPPHLLPSFAHRAPCAGGTRMLCALAARAPHDDAGRRRAYTLLELLLVLAILLIVAAAASPAVVGLLSDYRLREATEDVRFELSSAKLRAVDASSTCQFRFEPGGRHYLALATDADAANADAQSADDLLSAEVGLLPESLTFQAVASPVVDSSSPGGATSATASNAADAAWQTALAKIPNGADLASVVWSPPISFHVDGTASDASLGVVDASGTGYRITVRELTGEISVQRLDQGSY